MSSINNYIALDIEATGISPNKSRIIEIGAVKIVDGKEKEVFHSLVNSCIPIKEEVVKLTGIDADMLKKAPSSREVMEKFLDFCEDYVWLGHSVNSDYGYVKAELMKNNMLPDKFVKYGYDTLAISRALFPNLEKKSLRAMCDYYRIENRMEHRALGDVRATIELFEKLKNDYYKTRIDVFKQSQLAFKVKKIQKITNWQKNYLNDLVKYHKITVSDSLDNLTMSEASRLIDKIILAYGSKR